MSKERKGKEEGKLFFTKEIKLINVESRRKRNPPSYNCHSRLTHTYLVINDSGRDQHANALGERPLEARYSHRLKPSDGSAFTKGKSIVAI